MEISVDAAALDDPAAWYEPPGPDMPRHPFWVGTEVHVGWVAHTRPDGATFLVISSFDRETGIVTHSTTYPVFPAQPAWIGIAIDVAGSQAGEFAALVSLDDDSAPGGAVHRVVLGRVGEAEVVAIWDPPWSIMDGYSFDVGWDGEAFAVHALDLVGGGLWLVRLAPDGTELGAPVKAGVVGTTEQDLSVLSTSPETGRSWIASMQLPGAWITGHERDGTLVDGVGPEGGSLVVAQGAEDIVVVDGYLTGAFRADRSELAWTCSNVENPLGEVDLLPLAGVVPSSDVARFPAEGHAGARKAMAPWEDGWWMAMLVPDLGIEAWELGDTEVRSQAPLVPYERCSTTCSGDGNMLDVRDWHVEAFEDEIWFGFLDYTDCYSNDEHPNRICPYRIVKAKHGCRYATLYDRNYPR